jgi:hypothetical protein
MLGYEASVLQFTLAYCFVSQEKYSRFNKMFCTAHCRGGYYFSLDRKVAKDQDRKNLLPAGQLPARFSVGRLRAFLICHSEHREESVRCRLLYRFFAMLRMTKMYCDFNTSKNYNFAFTSEIVGLIRDCCLRDTFC